MAGPAQSYTVNFILVLSENVNETIQRMEDFLQHVVAGNMAGCVAEESTNITNVIFDVYEDEDMRTLNVHVLLFALLVWCLSQQARHISRLNLIFDSSLCHRRSWYHVSSLGYGCQGVLQG